MAPGAAGAAGIHEFVLQAFLRAGATGMGRLYQLMSEQGQFWKESWEAEALGRAYAALGRLEHHLPYAPSFRGSDFAAASSSLAAALTLGYDWAPLNTRRLRMAGEFLADNDELLDLIHANMRQAEFQHYNLEVYLAIAQLFRQNLDMLHDLDEISNAAQICGAPGRPG